MSASVNRVTLLGNLTRDPERRVTPKGTVVCQFAMALNESYKDGNGKTVEDTTFVDVEAFGKQAETIAKYVGKGRLLYVEGKLRLDTWETKEGEKRSKMKVVLTSFQFLPDGKDRS